MGGVALPIQLEGSSGKFPGSILGIIFLNFERYLVSFILNFNLVKILLGAVYRNLVLLVVEAISDRRTNFLCLHLHSILVLTEEGNHSIRIRCAAGKLFP